MARVQLFSIQSGSMAPVLERGDLIVLRPIAGSLRVGDIVTYRSPLNTSVLITHRIVAINRQGQTLTTKGDSSTQADPPFGQKLVVGRMVGHVARLGSLFDIVRTPYGLFAAVYLPAAVVIWAELRRLAEWFAIQGYVYRQWCGLAPR